MIVIDANRENEYRQGSNKDTEQDSKIVQMQVAIDNINNQVSTIQNELSALVNALPDRFSANTQNIMTEVESRIRTLSNTLSQSFSTSQITADAGIFQTLCCLRQSTIYRQIFFRYCREQISTTLALRLLMLVKRPLRQSTHNRQRFTAQRLNYCRLSISLCRIYRP